MPTELNGQPGAVFVDEEGRIASDMSVEIADGVVQTIRGITNPDKLAHSARSPTSARSCAADGTAER